MNTPSKENMLNQLKKRLMEKKEINEKDRQSLLQNLIKMEKKEVNLLITGATGSGKSSTINALFKTNVAKIGMGCDPETMNIQKYTLDNLVIWDSPGFGDGVEQDARHAAGVKKLLNETDVNGHCKIDLVLVLLDGGTRDYGTTYRLLEKVIIPNIGKSDCRILVAINQADMALSGNGWDKHNNQPTEKLITQLENKILSTQKRIKENTGVDITPIYYCAGYQDEVEVQQPYNLSKLLYFIVENVPRNKRTKIADNMTVDEDLYAKDDGIERYTEKTKASFADSLFEVVDGIVDIGAEVLDVVADTVVGVVNKAVDVGASIVRSVGSTVASIGRRVASFFG